MLKDMMSLNMELKKKQILILAANPPGTPPRGASKLNLFMAASNVFTFMPGQQSLLLPGNITLYEYDFASKKLGAYIPTFTL